MPTDITVEHWRKTSLVTRCAHCRGTNRIYIGLKAEQADEYTKYLRAIQADDASIITEAEQGGATDGGA